LNTAVPFLSSYSRSDWGFSTCLQENSSNSHRQMTDCRCGTVVLWDSFLPSNENTAEA
jgi:hypothetical protein